MFRLRAAGYHGPDLFSSPVVKYIARASEGLTRRVNLIADKALLAAFSENTHTVRSKHVDAAVRDSEFSNRVDHGLDRRYVWGAGLLAAGAVAGIGLYVLVQHGLGGAGRGAVAAPTAAVNPLVNKDNQANPSPASAVANPPQPSLTAAPAAAEPPPIPTAAVVASPEPTPTPAAPEATAPAPKTLSADAVEARLAATLQWLESEGQGTYSIQLMGAENTTQLKHHLNVISKSVEMNQVFVYRTVAKQKPSLTVLYGSFADRRAAQEALQALPASLKAYRPILRTVHGIRGEMRHHQTLEQSGNAKS
jgi:hypothetical protein